MNTLRHSTESTSLPKMDSFDTPQRDHGASESDYNIQRVRKRSMNRNRRSVLNAIFSNPTFKVVLGLVGLAGIVSVFVGVGKYGRNMHPPDGSGTIGSGGM